MRIPRRPCQRRLRAVEVAIEAAVADQLVDQQQPPPAVAPADELHQVPVAQPADDGHLGPVLLLRVLNFVCQKNSGMVEITEFREISAKIYF